MGYGRYRYIFIITYARSGSTLLQSILNSADGVQIRGENNNVAYHLHRAIKAVTNAKSFHGRNHKATARDHPWYGAVNLDPELFQQTLLDNFIEQVLVPAEDARVIGFKEIRHIPAFMSDKEFHAYMDFLLEAFPGARIVCNSRRAEDVRVSGFLRDADPATVTNDVQVADARFSALCARSDRCMHLQYEEYTQSPEILFEMLRFLDLPHDAARVTAVMNKPLDHARETLKAWPDQRNP